jgi:hypothetical protein
MAPGAARACLQVHLERRVRRHLAQILDLHSLVPLGALANQRIAEADRMRAHRRDQLVAHVAGG